MDRTEAAAREAELRGAWGAEIARLRKAKGMSQSKLAQSVGLDVGTISRIERGLYGGSDATRISIAATLGVEVHQLFTYTPVGVAS